MRLQVVLTSWASSHRPGAQERRASLQGWQAHRRGFKPFLAAANGAAGSPEQHVPPTPASSSQRLPVQQPPSDAWELARQQVAAFQRQHGLLPRASADGQGALLPGERALGLWCTEQQRRKAGSKGPPLTARERKALLAIPGWGWWASRRVTTMPVMKPWEQRRQEVEAFFQQHGRLPRATAGKASPFLPGEESMGQWVSNQRQQYKGNKQPPLSADRIAALEVTPGWAWEDYLPWESRYQQVQDFVRQHSRLPREHAGKSNPLQPGEGELGNWCVMQRQRCRGQSQAPPLSADQQAALAAIPGWYWDFNDIWEQQRQKLEAFHQQHGRLPRQTAGKLSPFLPGERGLGVWVTSQRQRFKGQRQQLPLPAEQQALLASIPGWYWDVEDDRWEQQRQKLDAFVRAHGRLPRVRPTPKGPLLEGERELAGWRQRQRQRERGTGIYAPLSAEQQAALKATPLWGTGGGP
ncbi:hypothetical protein N2152v2_009705 [Parachlorella kessleri]